MPPDLGGDDQAEDRGLIEVETPTYSRDLAQRRPLSEDEKVEQAKKRAAQAERDRLNPGLIAAIQAGEAATGRSRKANRLRLEASHAANELVRLNANLVHSQVKQHRTQHEMRTDVLDYDDLWQAGAIALLRAAERWQPGKAKFSTYATTAIHNAILRELADAGRTVRIPEGRQHDVALVRRAIEKTKGAHPDGWVDYEELAAECPGLSVDKVRELSTLIYGTDHPLDIEPRRKEADKDSPMMDDRGNLNIEAPAVPNTSLGESIAFEGPEQEYEVDYMHDENFLNDILTVAPLTEDELFVIECLHLHRNEWGEPAPLTLAETDDELHRRHGTAKELQESALAKLREAGSGLLIELLAA